MSTRRSTASYLVLALLLGGVTAGCASVPMASEKEDLFAKQHLTPAPGSALIVLYRNEGFGAAISMDVKVDGRPAGQTAAKVYFTWEVPPGAHVLESKAENTTQLPVNAQADHTYFVWQEVKMGLLMARSDLHLVDEATGKRGVAECKLARPVLRLTPQAPPPSPAVAGS